MAPFTPNFVFDKFSVTRLRLIWFRLISLPKSLWERSRTYKSIFYNIFNAKIPLFVIEADCNCISEIREQFDLRIPSIIAIKPSS